VALTAGSKLGPYEILAPLGAGGMGEVYRARDPKLERDLAVKLLPEGAIVGPARLARFEREAKLLAALSHPGIAAIFAVQYHHGQPALVLELIEGETLEDRLVRGALPVPEALEVARQIAEALGEAHEHGIIHRDQWTSPGYEYARDWSPDGRFSCLGRRARLGDRTSGSFRSKGEPRRGRISLACSMRVGRVSRRTDAGSSTTRTSLAGTRSTCGPSQNPVESGRFLQTEAGTRGGPRAGERSSSEAWMVHR